MKYKPGDCILEGWQPFIEMVEEIYQHEHLHDFEFHIDFVDVEDHDIFHDQREASAKIVLELIDNLPESEKYFIKMERCCHEYRYLLPSRIINKKSEDECWVKVEKDKISAVIYKGECSENESTIYLDHEKTDGEWRSKIRFTAVYDGPYSDVLTFNHDENSLKKYINDHGWNIDGNLKFKGIEDDEIIVEFEDFIWDPGYAD